MMSMSKEQNGAMRKKDHKITPFVQLSPRLNDQTSSGKGARILQRSRTTEREKDVQLDSHQQHVQGYRKYYRFGGDRINHDVPSYDRNHIGIEDKRRRGVLVWISGNEGMCRRGSPLNSGRDDDTESIRSEGQLERVGACQGKEVP